MCVISIFFTEQCFAESASRVTGQTLWFGRLLFQIYMHPEQVLYFGTVLYVGEIISGKIITADSIKE